MTVTLNRRSLLTFYNGPVILWMGIIFVMSSRAGSTEHSASLVAQLVRWVSPTFSRTLTPYQLECLDYGFRKICHVTEYAILALLVLRAVRFGRSRMSLRAIAFALIISMAYAATDEFHQVFVPLRTASIDDVLIDSSGAAAALLTAWMAAALISADGRIGSSL